MIKGPSAQPLSPHTTVFTSRAAAAMTSGVIISAGEALLIDPGVLPDEIEAIAEFVAAPDASVTALLLTHHHWDHILGTGRWPAARRIAHPSFEAWLVHSDEPLETAAPTLYAEYGFALPSTFAPLPITDHLDDGATLTVGELSGQLVYLPGHAGDALGLWLPAERTLFSSDMLDPLELPMPMQHVDLHLASLARIESLVAARQVKTVVPGHGLVLHGAAVIRAQIASDRTYLQALRTIAHDALARGEDFEAAWPRFGVMPYFGKGEPERDQEHRLNAAVTLERLRG
ncbi:MAG TPA: hypothetical protein DEP84_14110 [Chloroflexi bacterium]|nr:hypothetical protein [Chloroflexota bacterium]